LSPSQTAPAASAARFAGAPKEKKGNRKKKTRVRV
jgi:hypothetical protein